MRDIRSNKQTSHLDSVVFCHRLLGGGELYVCLWLASKLYNSCYAFRYKKCRNLSTRPPRRFTDNLLPAAILQSEEGEKVMQVLLSQNIITVHTQRVGEVMFWVCL